MGALRLATALLPQLLKSRAALVAENPALRDQIVILQRSVKRPRLHRRDRIFCVWLSRLWGARRSSTTVVRPETAPRNLLRHRDGIDGSYFADRVRGVGIEEVLIPPRSPWQSPYVERMIGSIRRECLDHVLEINEAHLLRVLREYFVYYHDSRPHQSLDSNAPRPREIEPPGQGRIVAEPRAGGLHHRYRRAA